MSTYRNEWPCCGSVTETEAWEPEHCPFCTPDESAQAAPARGAMTAGDCKIPARFTTNLSIDPLNLREHGINGWFDGQRYWSHDMADHWSAREIVLFELRAHGIGTTAPAGGAAIGEGKESKG